MADAAKPATVPLISTAVECGFLSPAEMNDRRRWWLSGERGGPAKACSWHSDRV